MRASRLRKRIREGYALSSEERTWLDAYRARVGIHGISEATASVAEVVGAVSVVLEIDVTYLRGSPGRGPIWIHTARRVLIACLRRAGYAYRDIAATVGANRQSARTSDVRARRDIRRGGEFAAVVERVERQVQLARQGKSVVRKRTATARPGDVVMVAVAVGSAAWRVLDRIAEYDELAAARPTKQPRFEGEE